MKGRGLHIAPVEKEDVLGWQEGPPYAMPACSEHSGGRCSAPRLHLPCRGLVPRPVQNNAWATLRPSHQHLVGSSL